VKRAPPAPAEADHDTPDARKEVYRRLLTPINAVLPEEPKWILPGLIPEGLTLIVAGPKVGKTHFFQHCVLAITQRIALFPESSGVKPPLKPKRVVLLSGEQSPGRLRVHYEGRVMRRKFRKGETDWNYCVSSDPGFSLDAPSDEDHSLIKLVENWEPDLLAIDPLALFHGQDENSPILTRDYILPLARTCRAKRCGLVIVHHLRKEAPVTTPGKSPWDSIRGHSALFGACDGAIYLTRGGQGKSGSGAISVSGVWKDAEERSWTWRPE